MKLMKKALLTFNSICLLFLSLQVQAAQNLVLGVYQYQSKDYVTQQYQGLANYLSAQLKDHGVELKVLNSRELINAVRNKQVDLLLANPYHYEVLRTEVALSGIAATIQVLHQNKPLDSLGGVIFTRANNSSVNRLEDIIGKTIAIPSKKNSGGYLIPLYEAYKSGIKLSKLNFIEVGHNDAVVSAVQSGKADLGFVRTGILENLQHRNGLNLAEIKLIHQQHKNSFPQRVSTRLYPEWPFVFLPGLSEDLQRDITVALFSLRADHPVAKQAGIAGFVAPRDYLPFENLLKDLKQPPFNVPQKLTLSELWHLYKWQIITLSLLLVSIITILIKSEVLRNKLKERDDKLVKQSNVDYVLLNLPKMAEEKPEEELMQFAIEEIERLTDSQISFIHLYDEQNQNIELVNWSRQTKDTCHVTDYEPHYPLKNAGAWADSIRQKKSVIINNFSSYAHRKGLPEGHVHLDRIISIPVVDKGSVVMIAGLGNKQINYTQDDVDLCQLICNETWHLIKEQRTDNEIKQQKNKFEHFLNDLGGDYFVYSHRSRDGVITYLSAGFEEVFEQPIANVLNKPWFSSIDWQNGSIENANRALQELVTLKLDEHSLVMSFTTPQGHSKTIRILFHGVYENEELVSFDGLVKDITQDLQAESHLKQAAQVFDYANEGILITDRNNQIIRANKRLEDISGYQEAELIGQNPRIFSSGLQKSDFYENMWETLISSGFWEGDILNRRQNGEFYPCRSKISVVMDKNREPEYYIGLFADVTKEKEYQEQLEHMAHYDALTGLPNRLLLSDRIHQAISLSERNNEIVAIMFIDLDGFKEINDQYGHAAGDHMLQTIAKRLTATLRKQDTVSRLGGDEFVILLSANKDKQVLKRIEQHILKQICNPIEYESHELQVSGSIGVVYYEADQYEYYEPDQLLRLADQIMYKAKVQGKNQIQYYEWDDSEERSELIRAFKNQDFQLYYQPKINFEKGEIGSLEGLVRWIHPEKGMIPPIHFLHKLEQFGLMEEFSIYILEQAAAYLERLHSLGHKVKISLNINGYDLLNEPFNKALYKHFVESDTLRPEHLILELLESSALENVKQISSKIDEFKLQGFRFAIDDFGTGYASLNYLKNLPVNEVKIDQEFILEIFNEPSNFSIIEAIKSMAEAFNLDVIAEGAETEDHIKLLLQLGIKEIQGYAINKPLSPDEIEKWLTTWEFDPKWHQLEELTKHHKELCKAKLSHHAWLRKVEASILKGDESSQIELSHTHCNFGRWFLNSAPSLFHNSTTIQQIDALHIKAHELAVHALDLHKTGEQHKAEAMLPELHQIKDDLDALLSIDECDPS